MRTRLSITCILFIISISLSNAQINNPFKVVKDKASQKANNEIDKEADKIVNPDANSNQDNTNGNPSSGDNTNAPASASSSTNAAGNEPVSVAAYQNYDFRAGDKIIFEDNFASDADGEFPSHWDLISGQAVVNKITGIPSFLLTDGNYCRVKPLMKTNSYLTDNFSVEYDTYLTEGAYALMVFFNAEDGSDMNVHVSAEGATWTGTKSLSGSSPTAIQYNNYYNKWHHVAIAYKNDQLKVYIDQYRVLTVPHCEMKPANVDCAGIGDVNNPIIFKNFKIADGASMNMLDAIMTNGKFVTHGINFDINSSKLKPESMGVIGDVAKYLKDHSDLKLEIDGHTDSDGDDPANLKLSQARADAVKDALVSAGIDASRLSSKGFGEAKPMAKNDSPEGKAENRRVEFVKI